MPDVTEAYGHCMRARRELVTCADCLDPLKLERAVEAEAAARAELDALKAELDRLVDGREPRRGARERPGRARYRRRHAEKGAHQVRLRAQKRGWRTIETLAFDRVARELERRGLPVTNEDWERFKLARLIYDPLTLRAAWRRYGGRLEVRDGRIALAGTLPAKSA
jgi:plasmid stabilization system protein ParE